MTTVQREPRIGEVNYRDEWVRIIGSGNMAGWILSDDANHIYTFPDGFTLNGYAVVHTRSGTDTDTELYWGRSAVWNNDHDTAYLKNSSGITMDTKSW